MWNSRFTDNNEAHTFPCDEKGDPKQGHELKSDCPCHPKDMSDVVKSYLHQEILLA